MLASIRQVNEEFFRRFYGLKMTLGGAEKTVLCRYARQSSYDYAEEQENQVYPCIAIQDYTPTPKKEWYIDMHAYFGGKSLDGLKGYLYQRPIWMEFRYDVSIVAKGYNEFISMQDYFMENFVYGKRFIFNQQLEGEDMVGDIVPYEIRQTDVPRTDGVFEMNYEFTCSVWLYPQKPEEVDAVQKVVLTGNHEMERTEPLVPTGRLILRVVPTLPVGVDEEYKLRAQNDKLYALLKESLEGWMVTFQGYLNAGGSIRQTFPLKDSRVMFSVSSEIYRARFLFVKGGIESSVFFNSISYKPKEGKNYYLVYE